MNYRRFGRTDWQVSEIGYGMWGMGGWTGSDDEESLRLIATLRRSRLQLLRYRVGVRRREKRGTAGPTCPRQPQKKLYTATKIPPKNSDLAQPARIYSRRYVSSRLHRAARA